ncbi:MAG: hypothetical protein R2784_01520 [Saprospiraceae bacterium]
MVEQALEDIISIFPDSDGQSFWTGITFSGELPINGKPFKVKEM